MSYTTSQQPDSFRGKATSCIIRMNEGIESFFEKVGRTVASWPYAWLAVIGIIIVCFGSFLQFATFETNIFDLWTPTNSPVFDERDFIDDYWADAQYSILIYAATDRRNDKTNLMSEEYIEEYLEFSMHLFADFPNINKTVTVNGITTTLEFSFYGKEFKEPKTLDELTEIAESDNPTAEYASDVIPLCRPFAISPLEAQFQLPCYVLSPLDCFVEGGFSFNFEDYLAKTFFTELAPLNPYQYRPSFRDLDEIALGEIWADSCTAWSGTVIPFNFILGGAKRLNKSDPVSQLLEVRSFETLMFTDAPSSVARKIKIATGNCTYTSFYSIDCPNPTKKEKDEGEDIIWDWLEEVIDWQLDDLKARKKDDSLKLEVVFWTPRTSGDLLKEASEADFGLLAIAYIAMIIFASLTAIRFKEPFLSRAEASCAGVVLVLLTVVATSGLGALFWKFSPNVVQVLPFIALGFGVDDMFVLLFSFHYRHNKEVLIEDMIGDALRVAGSSVALTSLSNFLAFFIASFMVLPDVARFAQFGMLMVLLNFITVVIGFSAILTLTARRMRSGYNDCAWFCCFGPCSKANKKDIKSELKSTDATSQFDPLFDFLTRDEIRIICMVLFVGFIVMGIYGSTLAKLGLPLADIVPEGTYAQDYLTIREKFFFSYSIDLYSDAHRNKLKPMDWENKIGEWITTTSKVRDINKIVYQTIETHDFWAWDFAEYLRDAYTDTFPDGGFASATIDLAAILATTDPRSYTCETDRNTFCCSIFPDYSYGSDMYNCLYYNYDNLAVADCQEYLDNLQPSAPSLTLAEQIEMTCVNDKSINGIYTRPSTDTSNVFYRSDGSILFQRSDFSWAILSNNFSVKAFGLGTNPGSEPSQFDWRLPDNSGAGCTLVAFDTVYYVLNLLNGSLDRSDDFLLYDLPERTSFETYYEFSSSDPTSNDGQYAYEVLQKLTSTATAYSSISLVADSGSSNTTVVCDAILESSELCVGIGSSTNEGNITCGNFESGTENTNWWFGSCNAGGITIVGNDGGTNAKIGGADACYCDNTNAGANSVSSTYLGWQSTRTFGNIVSDSSDTCGSEDQIISLTCDVFTDCTDLRACYEDIRELDNVDCEDSAIQQFQVNGSPTLFGDCLLPHYSELSSCCQEAVQANMIDVWTCRFLEVFSGSNPDVCSLRDDCRDDCTSICYNEIIADCSSVITSDCQSEYDSGDNNGLFNCILAANHPTCCATDLDNVATNNMIECIIPVSGYYNYNGSYYNYSHCDDSSYSGSGVVGSNTLGCGAYDATEAQLECIIGNKTLLDESCCKKAIDLIDVSYIFTKDCQQDVEKYCPSSQFASEASVPCLVVIGDEADLNNTTPNCKETIKHCPLDGDWPLTDGGVAVSLPCGAGYDGSMTRDCDDSSSIYAWKDVNDSLCSLQSCPSVTDSGNQVWPETVVGNIVKFFGNDVAGGWKLQKLSCSGLDGHLLVKYCHIGNDGNAVWTETEHICSGSIASDWAVEDNKVCLTTQIHQIPGNSSMIYLEDVSAFAANGTEHERCQLVCDSGLDNCVGYTYYGDISSSNTIVDALFADYKFYCVFYDFCELGDDPYPFLTSDPNGTFDAITYFTPFGLTETILLVCSNNDISDNEQNPPSEQINSTTGVPLNSCFDYSLWMWLVDPLGGVLYQYKFLLEDATVLYSSSGFLEFSLVSTLSTMYVEDLDDDEVAVDFILDLRDELKKWRKKELYVVPGGLVINLFSQYIGVEQYLSVNLAYVTIAIIFTGFIFLLHPKAIFTVLLCDAAMMVEVFGFVEWAGLRVNGVLALNMVIAIGLTMEFTAHMARAYILTNCQPNEKIGIPQASHAQIRMKKTYREMFTPVSLGAITTFLGVVPISAARFPYFRQYYFVLYLMIVIFGWLNGVIFLPIILSYLNPAPFHDPQHDLHQTKKLLDEEQNNNNNNNNYDNNTTKGGPSTNDFDNIEMQETNKQPPNTNGYNTIDNNNETNETNQGNETNY